MFSHAESRCCKQYEKSTLFTKMVCPFISKFTILQSQEGSFTEAEEHLNHFWSLETTNHLRSGRTCKRKSENTLEGNKPYAVFHKHLFTIESILLICLHCSSRPAPVDRKNVDVGSIYFDTLNHYVFFNTITSRYYFSQKPFVFRQDPTAVLHCYI